MSALAGPNGNYGAPSYITPQLYRVGFSVKNDGTTPNTIINVGAGQCRDSTDTFQIISNGNLTASNAFVGVGGLDVGTVTANTLYAIYVISDPVNNNPTSLILSKSFTGPLMPYGYMPYRLIDQVATDASSHFISMKWSGHYSDRMTTYLTTQVVPYTPATLATQINLSRWVPPIDGTVVTFKASIIPATTGNGVSMSSTGVAGNFVGLVTGSVLSVAQWGMIRVPISLVSGVPSVYATCNSASDTVVLNIASFEYFGG